MKKNTLDYKRYQGKEVNDGCAFFLLPKLFIILVVLVAMIIGCSQILRVKQTKTKKTTIEWETTEKDTILKY